MSPFAVKYISLMDIDKLLQKKIFKAQSIFNRIKKNLAKRGGGLPFPLRYLTWGM